MSWGARALDDGDKAGQEVIERRVEVDPDRGFSAVAVFVDVDLGEEGLVEQLSCLGVGLQVCRVAVPGQVEAVGEGGPRLLVVGGRCRESLFGARELAGDAVLFDLQEVDRDRTGVVGVEELLALGEKLVAGCLKVASFGFGGGVKSIEVVKDKIFDAVPERWVERQGAVFVFDEFLDGLDEHGLSSAGGAFA